MTTSREVSCNLHPHFLRVPIPHNVQNAARRINRTLTQKYDMGALRALQKLESDFLIALAGVYGVEEDEVPVELDLLQIYNSPEDARLGMLVRTLDT